jgi:hypothetical protein
MKRHFPGLAQAGRNDDALPDGDYLVQVKRIRYHWHHLNPFYSLHLQVLAPECHRSREIEGRLNCTVKALWKLNWFLTDFGYDPGLIDADEIDEKGVIGLKGVLRLSHRRVNGRLFPNLQAFAPADRWNGNSESEARFSAEGSEGEEGREVA